MTNIKEIQKNYAESIDFQLMKSFLAFSTKQKSDIESAISNLVRMANDQTVSLSEFG